jgi:hypothetical protein
MALLYADENFDLGVVVELRRRGHDVRTVQEAGAQGRDDATVLADASAEGRAVLTFNRKDFFRLHRHSMAHAGIVACTSDPDAVALAMRIRHAVTSAGVTSGQCLWVTRRP